QGKSDHFRAISWLGLLDARFASQGACYWRGSTASWIFRFSHSLSFLANHLPMFTIATPPPRNIMPKSGKNQFSEGLAKAATLSKTINRAENANQNVRKACTNR